MAPPSIPSDDQSGASGIEFGLIVSMLMILLLGVLSGWSLLDNYMRMRAAVAAGENYLLQGGTSDTVTASIATDAWKYRPQSASVSVTKSCSCANAASACDALCAGTSSLPNMNFSIVVSSIWTDRFTSVSVPISIQASVRVR